MRVASISSCVMVAGDLSINKLHANLDNIRLPANRDFQHNFVRSCSEVNDPNLASAIIWHSIQ